jgi:hypothetical protein
LLQKLRAKSLHIFEQSTQSIPVDFGHFLHPYMPHAFLPECLPNHF